MKHLNPYDFADDELYFKAMRKHRSQPQFGIEAKPGIFETAWQFFLSCAFWCLIFVLTLLGIGFIAAHGEKIDVWMETQTNIYGRSK